MKLNYSHLIGFTYTYALLTLFMVSFLIYKAKDFIRLFSLSGIEHMTLISLFWVSGGYFAALLHFAAHALFKPALFLSTGILEQNANNFKGVLKNINQKYVSLIISAFLLGVISLPPSPMFFSEIFGFKSMIDIAKHSHYFILMIIGIVFILILLSIIFYKFVNIYQEGMYEEIKIEKKVYTSEKIMLVFFLISLITLLFSFDYIDVIAKGLK
jgi:hydrogenase-4 component F